MSTATTEQLLELGRKIYVPSYASNFHTSLDGMLVNGYIHKTFDPFYDPIPVEIKLIIFAFFNIDYTQYIAKNTKHIEKKKETKILFLGIQFAGKSTMFKTLKYIHDIAPNQYEIDQHCTIIRQNCVAAILMLLKIFLSSKTLKDVKINTTLIPSIELIMKYAQKRDNTSYNFREKSVDHRELGEAIKSVITNIPELITIYEESNTLYPGNMKYFFHDIERIMCNIDYIPSQQDILKVSEQTIGAHQFLINQIYVDFRIIDIGGSWIDRFKWIDYFNGIDAMYYIAALSDFNKYLLDSNKNAMHESLELFDELINGKTGKWFKKPLIILILNKDDLFRNLLRKGISISVCFGEAWHGLDFNPSSNNEQDFDKAYYSALDFIRRQYERCNRNPYKRIFVYIMTATEQESVDNVFWDICSISVDPPMQTKGLI